uniref:SEC7 domain-containing protein n=1 Tax=Eptatretus burgeri TaxID=7764 RepID=A0A8C4Q9Q8_EPTBU
MPKHLGGVWWTHARRVLGFVAQHQHQRGGCADMDEALRVLAALAAGSKHRHVREASERASRALEGSQDGGSCEINVLREKCLQPFQFALESKNMRLGQHALAGIQKLLADERFSVQVERETGDGTVLGQLLHTLHCTPDLHEDLQVEVMKILLCVACSPTFELNSQSVLLISETCIRTYVNNTSVRSTGTAVRATLGQLLGDLAGQLRTRMEAAEVAAPRSENDAANADSVERAGVERLCLDVLLVLTAFCEKLQASISGNHELQLLYLEAILALLTNSSSLLNLSTRFTDLVWQSLCPSLIALLGDPSNDKSLSSTGIRDGSQVVEVAGTPSVVDRGRGSSCVSSTTALHPGIARAVFGVAAELVRLVGTLDSLRPVLQALYHRALIYPPPNQRTDAIRAVSELLGQTARLIDVAAPAVSDSIPRRRARPHHHLDLLKLMLDGVCEASLGGGPEACRASVACVSRLVASLEEISRGEGLSASQVTHLLIHADELAPVPPVEGTGIAVTLSNAQRLSKVLPPEWNALEDNGTSVSTPISVKTGAEDGHDGITTQIIPPPPQPPLPPPPFQPRAHLPPEVIGDLMAAGGQLRPPEEVESNRAELDSCDRYSTLVERDSARSDASELGSSENLSLVDDDDAMTEIPGPNSAWLYGGTWGRDGCPVGVGRLSQRLVRAMEAECERARLFLRALESGLPRLLAAPSSPELDRRLQALASNFCAGVLSATKAKSQRLVARATLLCGDGMYVLAAHVLLLNLKFVHSDYYRGRCHRPPVSQREFVQMVQEAGSALPMPSAWLEEAYNRVRQHNMLAEAGYRGSRQENASPLIAFLTDIDGLGSTAIGGQLVFEVAGQSPLNTTRQGEVQNDSAAAGACFARSILIGCWHHTIEVLSTPLVGRGAATASTRQFLLGSEAARERTQQERDVIANSLAGLRMAARISCHLGVAGYCAAAVARMADACCLTLNGEEKDAEDSLEVSRGSGVSLSAAHSLCMEAVLAVGLEMGSHNGDCWPHVFSVCEYIGMLEHLHFARGQGQPPPLSFRQGPSGEVTGADGDGPSVITGLASPGHTPGPVPDIFPGLLTGAFPGPQVRCLLIYLPFLGNTAVHF